MAKIKAGKPDWKRQAGSEGLGYTSNEKAVGGPVCNDPISGLNADKPVKGSKTIPQVKK
jgi:hypothetical protein